MTNDSDTRLRISMLRLRQIISSARISGATSCCELCEEYAKIVVEYLTEGTIEKEITEILDVFCLLLGSYDELCSDLVDYFTTLLFSELSSLDAATFCKDAGVCSSGGAVVTSCKYTVSEALIRLRNSDTQRDIVRALLKVCDSRKSYSSQVMKA